jgi:hypothetical protein
MSISSGSVTGSPVESIASIRRCNSSERGAPSAATATPGRVPSAADILRGRREFHRLPVVPSRRALPKITRPDNELLCDTVLWVVPPC